MKKLSLFIIFITISTTLVSQNSIAYNNMLGAADYSFNIGTQVGILPNNSYYLSNYFSPNAKLNLTPRFSIIVGIGVSYSQVKNISIYNNDSNEKSTHASQTSLFTHVSGIYKLTEKISINGTILLEETIINSLNNTPTMHHQYKDAILGVNYNVNKHLSINAQMKFSDNPYNHIYNNTFRFNSNSPFSNYSFY